MKVCQHQDFCPHPNPPLALTSSDIPFGPPDWFTGRDRPDDIPSPGVDGNIHTVIPLIITCENDYRSCCLIFPRWFVRLHCPHNFYYSSLFPRSPPGTGDLFNGGESREPTGFCVFLVSGICYGWNMVCLDAGTEWPGHLLTLPCNKGIPP